MALEEIRQEVISAANKEAQAIIDKATAESEAKLNEAKRTEEARMKSIIAQESARLEAQLASELTNLRQDVKISILAAKNEVIEKVLSSALQMLENLPEKELREILLNSLKSLPPEVSGEVLLSPKDVAKFGTSLVEEANRTRGQAGKFSGPTAEPSVHSGLRLRSKGYEIDLTFASRVAEIRASVVPIIANRLFGKD